VVVLTEADGLAADEVEAQDNRRPISNIVRLRSSRRPELNEHRRYTFASDMVVPATATTRVSALMEILMVGKVCRGLASVMLVVSQAPSLSGAENAGRFAGLVMPVLVEGCTSTEPAGGDGTALARRATPPEGDGDETESHQINFFHRTLVDLGGVVASPAHWNARNWAVAGLCVAATVATGVWVDGFLQDESQENRTAEGDRWSGAFGQLGTIYSLVALGGAGAYGWIAEEPKGIDVMLDGLETSIIASGIITPALKLAIGRSRPNKTAQDTDVFQPFGGEQSFPSGHATQAFGVASTLAFSFPDQPVIGGLAFAAAAGVGLSRINDDAHYASDVVAGALIGTYVGYRVVKANAARRRGVRRASVPSVDVAFAAQPTIELTWRW
jgi:membrane-associated phospholipid phosphatase